MTEPAPLELHREIVRPEWIDYNGHMNVAYYLLAFDHAADAFLDHLGMDADYRERTNGSTFTVDTHITYQQEVILGAPLRFTIQLLGYDEKRIHAFQCMFRESDGVLAATHEWLNLHVDLGSRRVTPFPAEVRDRLATIHSQHRGLPRPEEAGRVIKPLMPPDA